MKQLESCFKRRINCNKYQPELKNLPQKGKLNYLIDPSFQVVNRLFVLPFENETVKYYHPTAERNQWKKFIL